MTGWYFQATVTNSNDQATTKTGTDLFIGSEKQNLGKKAGRAGPCGRD